MDRVEVRRTVFDVGTSGRHNLANKLVPRRILFDAIMDPFVKGVDSLRVDSRAIQQQQIGAVLRPDVNEFRSLQQCVNHVVTLFSRLIGQEVTNFSAGRQCPDGVQIRATDEHFIRATR